MTSKLVVNTIEADTGISSVSFASSISMSSTSVFHFSDAGVNIGADTNISRLGNGILGFKINGAEKFRIDSSGHIKATGVCTATAFHGDGSNLSGISSPAITSIASDGANRVLTSDGDGTATAHSFVTIENNRLSVNRGSGSGAFPLIVRRTDASGIIAEFANSSGYGLLIGQNSATGEAYLRTGTGQPMVFTTNSGSGLANERLRIASDGKVSVGSEQTTHTFGVTGGASQQFQVKGGEADIWMYSTGSNKVWRLLGSTGGSTHQFRIFDGHAGADRLFIGSTGRLNAPAVYSTAISSPMRDLHIESTGQFGYNPSVRASKINIADNNDVSWLYKLTPKTYNKRKRVSNLTNEWTNEAETDLQYGLIAEDVELVNSNICFYDVDDSNKKTLAGVTYSQLITPLLKALQEQKAEIDALKTRITTLEGS